MGKVRNTSMSLYRISFLYRKMHESYAPLQKHPSFYTLQIPAKYDILISRDFGKQQKILYM